MGSGRDIRIVFEEDGYPRELIDAADRARAVREEILTPDMDVTVYRHNEPPGVFKARDIEELKPLFGLDRPEAPPEPAPAPPPPAPLPPAPAPPPSEPPSSPAPDTPEGPAPPSADLPPAAPAEAEAPPGPAPAPPPVSAPARYTFVWVLLGIILMLYLLAKCSGGPGVRSDAPANLSVDDPLIANDVAAADPPEEVGPADVSSDEIAASVIRYAVRETNVRHRATAASRTIGKLDRGERISGVEVPGVDPGKRWFKITSGQYAGYFVSAEANVSEAERPTLDTSFSGAREVLRYSPIYVAPDRSSRVLQQAEPGTRLEAVGLVADNLVEISLKSGAIAYVGREAFEAGGQRPADDEIFFEAPGNEPAAPPPQPVDLSRPMTLLNRNLLSQGDYPEESVRENETGSVGFTVEVTAEGRPRRCRVIRSSGYRRLDRATCRVVESRARFAPARDAAGEPTAAIYEGNLVWSIN